MLHPPPSKPCRPHVCGHTANAARRVGHPGDRVDPYYAIDGALWQKAAGNDAQGVIGTAKWVQFLSKTSPFLLPLGPKGCNLVHFGAVYFRKMTGSSGMAAVRRMPMSLTAKALERETFQSKRGTVRRPRHDTGALRANMCLGRMNCLYIYARRIAVGWADGEPAVGSGGKRRGGGAILDEPICIEVRSLLRIAVTLGKACSLRNCLSQPGS